MAYKVSCADAGSECPGSFTTATEEELMEIVHLHQSLAHPDIQQSEESDAFVKTIVKTA
jgi:predicted small metal-binding protein